MSASPPGHPRANAKAYCIITKPYFGILYEDQLWSPEEWEAAEHRREQFRRSKAKRRAFPLPELRRGIR